MRFAQSQRVHLKTLDEEAKWEISPGARSASIGIAPEEGTTGWGTAVITVEVSTDGRTWIVAHDYWRLPIGTVSSTYANASGRWIAQMIDVRGWRYLRARVSTVGTSGNWHRVYCVQTDYQPDVQHGRTIVLQTSPTTTSTSYSDITGLWAYVLAGHKYLVDANVIFQSTSTGEGIMFSLNGPAATQYVIHGNTPISDIANPAHRDGRAYDTLTTTTGVGVANGNYLAKLSAYVNPSASGYLVVRWRAEAGGGTLTTLAGSSLKVKRL